MEGLLEDLWNWEGNKKKEMDECEVYIIMIIFLSVFCYWSWWLYKRNK